MSENLARCRRCHDVFDPDEGRCPRCGTPYQPIASPPPPEDGTYADRYAGSQFAEPVAEIKEVAPHANDRAVLGLMVAGGVLVVMALLVVAAFGMGFMAGTPTNPPVIVSIAPATSVPPSPTPIPQIAMALRALNDPNLNAHVLIQNRTDQDSVIIGHAVSSAITLDCQLSNGNELVMYTQGSKTEEVRVVDGKYYLRIAPGTKWTQPSAMSAWAIILPLFNIQNAQQIQFVGAEERDGQQTYHFQTTNRWAADIGRMGLLDASVLSIKPDQISLDIWTDSFGNPVYASFSAQNLANDGRKLVDIETTYTFTNVGTPVDIMNPFAPPTPTPAPTPTPE